MQIRLCSTLRGLSPECYDVLVNERVLNLPPRRFFLAHGAPTNWEIRRQIKEKEAEVRQRKVDGLRMRAEKVRQEKAVEMAAMAAAEDTTAGGKRRRAKARGQQARRVKAEAGYETVVPAAETTYIQVCD